MFATRYFAARAFAPRYFAKVGADPISGGGLDGMTTSALLLGVGH